MKSQALRSSRFTSTQAKKRKNKNSSNKLSQSPTLASSYSQKSLLAHSYKNQPFPKQFRRKLWGKKFDLDLDYFSDQEEQISAVVQEEQQGVQKKIKKLPHFKIIADKGEFMSKRSRIKSQVRFRYRQKCKSVQSLKCLPQVQQQKRQQDELKRLQRSKLSYFKDKNQFNQRKNISSDSHTQKGSKAQSLQNTYIHSVSRDFPQQIQQNQAQQTKSVKLPGQKSIITAQIQKLIVDELDSRRRKQQSKPQDIQQIIMEQKGQQDDQNSKVSKLRQSLDKFQTQSQYLKQLKDQLWIRKSGKEQTFSQCSNQQNQADQDTGSNKIHHQLPLQREKLYEEIRQQSSSGKEDDYQEEAKLPNIDVDINFQKEQSLEIKSEDKDGQI